MGIASHLFLLDHGNDVIDWLLKDLIDTVHLAPDVRIVNSR